MANLVKWSALNTFATGIAGGASAPTLKNLANNAAVLGPELDFSGAGERHQFVALELLVRGASAFTAGGYAAVWFLRAVDGTTYEDGDASVTPARDSDVILPVRAVSTAQRIAQANIPLPPFKTKFLVQNKGGQAFTNTDNENVLSYRTYDDEIQ
jgi:hypothetical protein